MKLAEFPFNSLQGEGQYCGIPALFVRISGCNRRCNFCDTSYAWNNGIEIDIKALTKTINESPYTTIIFTGGEPLMVKDELYKVIRKIWKSKLLHLETNGDLISKDDFWVLKMFSYIAFSPKDLQAVENVQEVEPFLKNYDIKIVTDLKNIGTDLLPYATILMPLTVKDETENLKIKQKVWQYCVDNKIRYSPRIHIDVWGVGKRSV